MSGTELQSITPKFLPPPEIIGGDCSLNPPVVVDSQFPATAPAYDKTTQAALEFFEAADNAAIKPAFNRVLEIVFKARKSLFLTNHGLSSFDATHEFLESWLQDRLLPYLSAGTFHDAAQRGEFKYLAKQGRNAIVDELRRRKRSQDALDRKLDRMDEEIESDDSGTFTLHDLLGLECHSHAVCPLGTKPSLEPSVLQEILQQCQAKIAVKLGEKLSGVLSTVCGLFPNQLSPGDVTRGIAKALAVSEQTARKRLHALVGKLVSLWEDPAVRGLVETIRGAGDPIHLSTGAWDAQSRGVTPN